MRQEDKTLDLGAGCWEWAVPGEEKRSGIDLIHPLFSSSPPSAGCVCSSSPSTHQFKPLNEKSDLPGSGQGSFVTLPCNRTEKESPPTAPPGLEMLHINNAHCKGGEGNPERGKTYPGALTMARVLTKGIFTLENSPGCCCCSPRAGKGGRAGKSLAV